MSRIFSRSSKKREPLKDADSRANRKGAAHEPESLVDKVKSLSFDQLTVSKRDWGFTSWANEPASASPPETPYIYHDPSQPKVSLDPREMGLRESQERSRNRESSRNREGNRLRDKQRGDLRERESGENDENVSSLVTRNEAETGTEKGLQQQRCPQGAIPVHHRQGLGQERDYGGRRGSTLCHYQVAHGVHSQL